MEDGRRTRLRRHLQLIDDGVAPVAARYAGQMECREGCSDCCHQTFRISELEGAYLREGLAAADPEVAADIRKRAARYAPDVRTPCPVLSGAGSCRLYAHRPRICRKYGIPIWHADRPHEVSTCDKNFRGVADIDAGLILDPQAEWARDWIRLRDQLGLPEQDNRTIAGWLADPVRDDP